MDADAAFVHLLADCRGARVGARTRSCAMVGAGAVVTRDVPAGATGVGNPARLSPRSETDESRADEP